MFSFILSICFPVLLGYATNLEGAIIYFMSSFIVKRCGLFPALIIAALVIYLDYQWWYYVLIAQLLISSTFYHYAMKHINEASPEQVAATFNMVQIFCGALALVGTVGCISSLL